MLGMIRSVSAAGGIGLGRWAAGRRRRGSTGRRAHQPRLERLEERLTLSTATWSGLGIDTNWTTAGNWMNNMPPNPGDDVLFPSLAGTMGSYTSVNNYNPGTNFNFITIGASGYNISGASVVLTSASSDILTTYTSGTSTDGLSTTLDSGTISVASGGTLNLSGQISGSAGLSLLGGGTLDLLGANTYTGTTTVTTSNLFVDSTTGAVTLHGGALGGNGTVGTVSAVGGTIRPGHSPNPGVLNTNSMTLDSTSAFDAVLDGTLPGNGTTGYDQVVAGGPVNLGGAMLNVSVASGFTPTEGQQFTIIQNNSASPITGTFAGLPEGASVTANGVKFQISYMGGTNGNNVVLTVLSNVSTTTTLTTSSQVPAVGQPVTFTATVTPFSPSLGTPTGTVTFFDGTTPIGQAALGSSGQAMFTTSSLAYGVHSITATYSGSDVFQGSTSGAVLLFVTSASTSPVLTIVPLRVRHGIPGKLELVAQINVAGSATGTPLGNAVFYINGRAKYQVVPVIDGRAVLTMATARLNNKQIYARYLGYFNEFEPALTNTVLINRWTLRALTATRKAVAQPHLRGPKVAAGLERHTPARESSLGKSHRRA